MAQIPLCWGLARRRLGVAGVDAFAFVFSPLFMQMQNKVQAAHFIGGFYGIVFTNGFRRVALARQGKEK